jgi:hypothetical protein
VGAGDAVTNICKVKKEPKATVRLRFWSRVADFRKIGGCLGNSPRYKSSPRPLFALRELQSLLGHTTHLQRAANASLEHLAG